MLHSIINAKVQDWLHSQQCSIRPLLQYIRERGGLREAQVEAVETYLFLKISGLNKPLWQLFADGFFNRELDLSSLHISQQTRRVLENNPAAMALFQFASQKNDNGTALPELEKYILAHPGSIDYTEVIRKIFYGTNYTDYLFSLPMGAGKTFLMATFIYLDLYFAINEPENPVFAHNFIILAPSGLKSSIIPSLKTIEKFNPAWVVPEPTASALKKLIKFEILDQAKTAKKGSKQNPNAQKITQHQPFADLMGLVMLVNAEKVILDRIKDGTQLELLEQSVDEKDKQANGLRNLIGKIPGLQIHIDEVHHAQTDEIKLRQVVGKWHAASHVNSVVGYSGTPYLASPEKIKVSDEVSLKFSQITNTVHYYPLTLAIRNFLKKPRVEVASGLQPLQIIEKGVRDFYQRYQHKTYANGTCAKAAIYCGSIERLEKEVYPFLVGELKIPAAEILKYHKGNKDFKLPVENETEFNSLDTPLSKKKVVLLVQVGKEGWDCRSLTGVILSQKGDSPANMVLQTSCRCLRQVDRNSEETALIWLNHENAQILNKQLKEEQHTSIEELNKLAKTQAAEQTPRFSRLETLNLPAIDFFQLRVEYNELYTEHEPNTRQKLTRLLHDASLKHTAVVRSFQSLRLQDDTGKTVITEEKGAACTYGQWLACIAKESFGSLQIIDLKPFGEELEKIFGEISIIENGETYLNELYGQEEIRKKIRLAFHRKRELQTRSETIPQSAQMLLVGKLQTEITAHDKLYPNPAEVQEILAADRDNRSAAQRLAVQKQLLEQTRELFRQQGMENMIPNLPEPVLAKPVQCKDRSFHFLPYDFRQSRFEMDFLKETICMKEMESLNLEMYFNGEKDITDFRIDCFARKNDRWQRVGLYTPDFLLIRRDGTKIHKILIIETKGSGFAEQSAFLQRKHFVETEFLKMNNEAFKYQRFEYLYLADSDTMDENLGKLKQKINAFMTA